MKNFLAETLWRKNASTRVQLLRALVVGGISFVFDFAILYGLTEYAGSHYLVSAAVGFAAGVVITYLLSAAWVFPNRKVARRLVAFGLFTLFGSIGLLLSELIMWGLVEFAAVHYLAAKIVATLVVFFFNFFSRKHIIFG
jgi:putative flippase GtrA